MSNAAEMSCIMTKMNSLNLAIKKSVTFPMAFSAEFGSRGQIEMA